MAIFKSTVMALLLCGCATVSTQPIKQLKVSDVATGAKYTVVYFWATQCPCVTRYQSRIEALAARYAHQGFSFVAVSSNSDDSEEHAKQVAKEQSLKLPLLKDWTGSVAEELSARTTPTVVVLDPTGRVHFRGWIDNERYEGEDGRTPYLENAIRDLSAGREVAMPLSPIYGCRITKRLR